VQAMIAASLASGVGEAISASRWYWAVMSAFVIFLGATTRGGILTRAVRRVTGTAAGIAIGVGVVSLTHGEVGMLVGISVVGVFGMLYLGPLNYVYSSTFMTITLVALYRMLGVLEGDILELRLVETICGVVIGVLAAYLVVSDSSRPTLVAAVDAYFAALDALLQSAGAAFAGADGRDGPLSKLHALEEAQAHIDQSLAAAATALVTRHRRDADAVHVMYIATRSAALLGRAAASRRGAAPSAGSDDADYSALAAIEEVRQSCARTGRFLRSRGAEPESPQPQGEVTALLGQSKTGAQSPQAEAIVAVARIDWAMQRLVDAEPSRRGSLRSAGIAVPPQ